jgi:hypothetical protein
VVFTIKQVNNRGGKNIKYSWILCIVLQKYNRISAIIHTNIIDSNIFKKKDKHSQLHFNLIKLTRICASWQLLFKRVRI